jgi:predicted porin
MLATEDLGGGLKVNLMISTDFADQGGATQDTTNTAVSAQTSGFANGETWIELSSAMGSVRLGTVATDLFIAASSIGGSLGTGIGSAHSSSFSGFNGYGTGATGSVGLVKAQTIGSANGGVRTHRQANTIKYISPSFNGITFAYGVAPKNDAIITTTVDTVCLTDYSVRYTEGAIDLMYAAVKYEVGQVAPVVGGLTPNTNNTHTIFAGSYQISPSFKLHAALGTSASSSATVVADSSSRALGLTWKATPMVDVMVQTGALTDNSTTAYNRGMTGFGVNYNFTKTTRAYFRYDNIDYYTNGTAANGTSQVRNALGISKSF